MNSSNIHHIDIIKQDATVGYVTKKGLSLTNLIQNLIREYGIYRNNNLSVDVHTLDISDKRLILSHFESAEWYEYACESSTKTEALFNEHVDHIQELIDEECGEVYQEIMEEMRSYK